jgi:tetratricopeptide (TPR) repeat protein
MTTEATDTDDTSSDQPKDDAVDSDDETSAEQSEAAADSGRLSVTEAAEAGQVWHRKLRPDELVALEEQRDFLLRSLHDLEREHEAGDVDETDYVSLRDDYTARAARVIRTIESHSVRVRRSTRRATPWRRVGVVAGVVVFALLAGVLVQQAAGRRDPGDTMTGGVDESPSQQQEPQEAATPFDEALVLASEQQYPEAIDILDQVLQDEPDDVEALTYKGWFQYLSGARGDGLLTLIDAAELDPEYPDVHAFLAVAFSRLGRPDSALAELDRLDELDPPPEVTQLADQLRADLESEAG